MELLQTSQFKKDIRKQIKKGKDPKKLAKAIQLLLIQKQLPTKYKAHRLRGHWVGRRDCHIEPDWVLIYRVSENQILLERTGTHSELF